jgi:LysM repeat protein
MLPTMDRPEPEPSPPAPASSPLELLELPVAIADAEDIDVPGGCPFLLAEGGGWRLDLPSSEHRCAAVTPAAALSPEKQARLCLTAAHPSCATYQASVSARSTRLGTPSSDRATRWALARTTTVIEDAGGLRTRVAALLLDRRRWPAIPAVLLVGTLFTLAVSGLNGSSNPVSATSAPSDDAAATPSISVQPTTPASSPEPGPTQTSAPTTAPDSTPLASHGPTETFRTYKVKSGDTLSALAAQFGTTARAIADLNGITVRTTLHIGQVLTIPNPG